MFPYSFLNAIAFSTVAHYVFTNSIHTFELCVSMCVCMCDMHILMWVQMHVPWHWCEGKKAILSVRLCLLPYLREGFFVQHCVYQVHGP